MPTASWFITALEARNNIVKDIAVHGEICAIEHDVLHAVHRGDYEITVTNSGMTGVPTSGALVFSADAATNTLLVPNHGFSTGDQVTVSSTGTLPPPLLSLCVYYVIVVDADHIRLATTRVNALAGQAIAIDISQGVTSVILDEPGSGYLTAPQVRAVGGTQGTEATFVSALLSYGGVHSVSVLNPGAGFTDVPITVVAPVGSGAAPGAITFKTVSVQAASAGLGYNVGDLINVVGGTGVPTVVRVTATLGGGVSSVVIDQAGNYSVLPTLSSVSTSTTGTGSGCELNLVMGIASIAVLAAGFNYINPPLVTVSGGGGSGAQVTCVINGGTVSAFVILNAGSGYTSTPAVSITSGLDAQVQLQLAPTGVDFITIVDAGSSLTDVPVVTLDSQGVDALAGVVTLKVTSAQIVNGGVDYSQGDQLLVSGGAYTQSCVIQVLTVNTSGQIITFNIINNGSYVGVPILAANNVLGGSGSGASFDLSMGVNTIQVQDGGVGYVAPPRVIISGTGEGAQAISVLNADSVSEIIVTASGAGYTTIPGVLITSGSGAQAVAFLNPTGVGQIQITDPGSGYVVAPIVSIQGGGGSGATADAVIQSGEVVDIIITDPGIGYTSVPTVVVDGNATATATLQPTSIESISVISSGADYTSPPLVAFSQGDAVARCVMQPTGVSHVTVTAPGNSYITNPVLVLQPGPGQVGSPTMPITRINRSFGVAGVNVVTPGNGYTSVPTMEFGLPTAGGTVAEATAQISTGSGVFTITPYAASRDYFLVWQNSAPSSALLVRPYQDQMAAVIKYFTDLGYTITRETNPTTTNTFQWRVLW